jgi:hypothetical protein
MGYPETCANCACGRMATMRKVRKIEKLTEGRE